MFNGVPRHPRHSFIFTFYFFELCCDRVPVDDVPVHRINGFLHSRIATDVALVYRARKRRRRNLRSLIRG